MLLFDTNILIDFLRQKPLAVAFVNHHTCTRIAGFVATNAQTTVQRR